MRGRAVNYGVSKDKRVTLICECGAAYTTRAVAAMGACDECMTRMRETFWAIWDAETRGQHHGQ